MERKPMLLISACLMGIECRYDGKGQAVPALSALMDRFTLIPLCPEQLGGLPTPRTPSERRGGGVFTRDGTEVTEAFARGADQAVRLARLYGARHALLKARSPSCGCGEIYDGSFSGRTVPGMGVAAEALSALGITIYSEEQLDLLLGERECTRDDTIQQ